MNRLDLISSLAKGSRVLCDVGCDHAYAIIKALTKYGVERGIASDINEGPLKQAKEGLIHNGLLDRVDLVLSNGFKEINQDFDTAIIAGMGGILISNILGDSLEKIKDKKLILEPNSDAALLRSFLVKNGFDITDEHAIIDMGKYYEIIVACPGKKEYSDLEIKYGPILLNKRPEAFIKHYEGLIDHLSSLLSKINNPMIKEEKANLIAEYKEIIK